jgi:hypothetical protein
VSDVDLSILLDFVLGVDGYEVSRFGELINYHPNRVKLAGKNKHQCGINFDIHDSAKWMKDKRLKALAKPQ